MVRKRPGSDRRRAAMSSGGPVRRRSDTAAMPRRSPVVRRASAPTGAPIWIDVMTSNAEATKAFYGSLFGWTVVDPGPEYGGYVNFHLDGEPIAGCMQATPDTA